MSEHKGQNWVVGVGRGQPPPCLRLGADIAVISALLQLPPPPWLALPSCVKTLAGFACWPHTPLSGPSWAQDGQQCLTGRARCGEWVVDQWAPWDLWPGHRPQFPAWPSHRLAACVALGLWGGCLEGFGHVGVGCCCEPQHGTWAADPCTGS